MTDRPTPRTQYAVVIDTDTLTLDEKAMLTSSRDSWTTSDLGAGLAPGAGGVLVLARVTRMLTRFSRWAVRCY